MKKLDHRFYDREDVVMLAKQLLGKLLVTEIDGIRTSGRIVETEAYAGSVDRASHAYGGRRTNRTEIIFGGPGKAYVYLCYGIHHLFNVVTNKEGVPHAILIRAVEPVEGIEDMLLRTGKQKVDFTLTRGPGNVSRALGIRTNHTGADLLGNLIYIVDDNWPVNEESIISSARIGVDYAGVDASLLYRFYIKGNRFVSGKKQQNNID
jgi:DNA-3-methyladenine glycosylase